MPAKHKTSISTSKIERATELSNMISRHLLIMLHGSNIRSSDRAITSRACSSEFIRTEFSLRTPADRISRSLFGMNTVREQDRAPPRSLH